jgi:ribosome-binding protein aMBF1 (putative translation factor)
MKEAREAQGVTLEGLAELTGYPADFLQRMEDEGQTAPRVVTSRISAVLGVEHVAVRGEEAGQVTRIRDIAPGE